MRVRTCLVLAAAALGAVGPLLISPASAAPDPAATVGSLSPVFAENADAMNPTTNCKPGKDPLSGRTGTICNPAAASVMVMPNGKLLYWDALEGMEDVDKNVVLQYGTTAQNDQTRLLDLATRTWTLPQAYDGGANPGGADDQAEPLLPGSAGLDNSNKRNDGDLFCSDQVFLADGRILDAGGTFYYTEPALIPDPTRPGDSLGPAELQGLKNTRLYDPATNTFSQSGRMNFGRWYPSLVTLPDSRVFVASGVTKLIKPLYPNRPLDSGTNVTQTETYDPGTGVWTVNGKGGQALDGQGLRGDPASRSLPLYPRLHLLPDGKVYYDAGGQTFNPQGQSYDEALWNQAAAYDPKTQRWATLTGPTMGVPVSSAVDGAPALPTGFRGSAFSQMMTLQPDAQGAYTTASFLSAGGVLGVSPGSYFGTATSTINTVDTAKGDLFTSAATGNLHSPRWYGNAVTLPTGQVVVTSGADRDEVINPGSGTPNKTIEIFDPTTKIWTVGPPQERSRTYHNTGVLLPDGSVLIGGHAPIGTGYGVPTDAGTAAGLSSYRRDPSFQIYRPKYFTQDRPAITAAPPTMQLGTTVTVGTTKAAEVTKVVLVRNTALTHLVDGDQRTVSLPFTRNDDGSLAVRITDNAAVLPAGPYLLFTVTGTGSDEVPSVASQLFVNKVGDPAATAPVVPPAGQQEQQAAAQQSQRPAAAKPTGTATRRGASSPARTAVQPARASRAAPAQPTRTLAFTGLPGGAAVAILPVLLLGAAVGVGVWRRRLQGGIAGD